MKRSCAVMRSVLPATILGTGRRSLKTSRLAFPPLAVRYTGFPLQGCGRIPVPSVTDRSSFRYSACAHTSGIAAPAGPPKTSPFRSGSSHICSGSMPPGRCKLFDRRNQRLHIVTRRQFIVCALSRQQWPHTPLSPCPGRDRRRSAARIRRGCSAASMALSAYRASIRVSTTFSESTITGSSARPYPIAHQFQKSCIDQRRAPQTRTARPVPGWQCGPSLSPHSSVRIRIAALRRTNRACSAV